MEMAIFVSEFVHFNWTAEYFVLLRFGLETMKL